MQMIRRFGRYMIARTVINRLLVAGCRFWCPARCPRLTLVHRRRRGEWGRRHRVWHLRHWRHCIFRDESRFSLCHSDGRARVRWGQCEGLIDACFSQHMEIAAHLSWSGMQSIIAGGAKWSSWMGWCAGIATFRFWGTTCCLGRERSSVGTLCLCQTMSHLCSTWHGGIAGPTWRWGHGLASYECRHEPNRTCLGSNVNLDPIHGSHSFQSDRIASSCRPSMASSSGEKGEGTSVEHASSSAACYRC